MAETARDDNVTGLIGWFAKNHVAANLLMIFIIVMGFVRLGGLEFFGVEGLGIKKETMPEFNIGRISVSVPFRGGAPEEVERGVVLKIEEAIESLEGIEEIESTASEGAGTVNIDVQEGYDENVLMDEIKLAVDGISTFPAETERPIIRRFTPRMPGIQVQVAGPLDEMSLKELTVSIRDEMLALPKVTFVQERGTRPFEIAVELPEQTLREYGLTLNEVSETIRKWSLDLPGGNIRSEAGDIRLRTNGQAYTGEEFADIVLMTQPDGTRLRLGEVATITDGFTEEESYSFFNGF